jgi:actin related protein 2/3 complex subunit 4
MALSTQNYLKTIRDNLDAFLNLRYFPSQLVERQVHPEVEFKDNAKLLLDPVVISKSENECCLIEASVNSVRVSISIKKSAEVEILLTHMLERFMSLRADKFEILRKKPAFPEYDFSFLISDDHL